MSCSCPDFESTCLVESYDSEDAMIGMRCADLDQEILAEDSEETTENEYTGFRDCAICLETLQGEMTFVIPCGHVFHTQCYRNWSETRYEGRKELQCACCKEPEKNSFHVCKDYKCAVCRQSIYKSHQPMIFTVPDKRLVHDACWTRFQQYGKPFFQGQQKGVFSKKESKYVSFHGTPVDKVFDVYLFDSEDALEELGEDTLSVFLKSLATTLISQDGALSDKIGALRKLILMVRPAGTEYCPSRVDEFLDALETDPTRQTVLAAMNHADLVLATASIMQQHHPNDTSAESKQCFEFSRFLLVLLCVNHDDNCRNFVQSGGFEVMLFHNFTKGSTSDDPIGGLKIIVDVFLYCEQRKRSSRQPTLVQSGCIEATLASMKRHADIPTVQWIGARFLLELATLTKPRVLSVLQPKWHQLCRERILKGSDILYNALEIHRHRKEVVQVVGRLLLALGAV
jgi:RING-like zinc finger